MFVFSYNSVIQELCFLALNFTSTFIFIYYNKSEKRRKFIIRARSSTSSLPSSFFPKRTPNKIHPPEKRERERKRAAANIIIFGTHTHTHTNNSWKKRIFCKRKCFLAEETVRVCRRHYTFAVLLAHAFTPDEQYKSKVY